MGDRRDEFAFREIRGGRFDAAELGPEAVTKGREISHVLLRIEKPTGMDVPCKQAGAVPVVHGVKDREESNGASVANDFPQQSSVAVVSGVCTRQFRFSIQSGPTRPYFRTCALIRARVWSARYCEIEDLPGGVRLDQSRHVTFVQLQWRGVV